jgi:signal transduction histidine kinase
MTPKRYWHEDRLAVEAFYQGLTVLPYEKSFTKNDGSLVDVVACIAPLENAPKKFVMYLMNTSWLRRKQRKMEESLYFSTHELKTPLTSTKGFVQLLERKMANKNYAAVTQYIPLILQNMERIEHLCNDINVAVLTDKATPDMQLSTFNSTHLIQSAVKTVLPICNGHKIEITTPQQPCFITADWFRLEQVITNLLTNAIKYSPNANTILIRAEQSDDTLLIQVTDFGIGIKENSLRKIFVPFHRETNATATSSGQGIGLYLSAEIVRRHSGRMTATSKPDIGTTFTVFLPVSPSSKLYEEADTRA